MEHAGETELLMHQPRRVVLPHMLVGSYPHQAGSGGGLLPGPYPVGSMGPPGYIGRYLAPSAPEPPSTQMVPGPLLSPPVDPMQCYSDHCEFCVRVSIISSLHVFLLFGVLFDQSGILFSGLVDFLFCFFCMIKVESL